ncbi:cache domain-containing protein, partial [Gammaproteobacteria bacterium]|nr:cache domain-containing protein [Gammaproteobacteria bacterium]
MSFTLFNIYNYGSSNIQQQGLRELNLYAEHIDAEFNSLSRVAQNTANFLSVAENISEEDIYELLSYNVQQSSLIYGSAIAFEPFSFDENLRLFAPYVYGEGDNLNSVDIGADSYDYSNGNWEWFSAARETQTAFWTEPFFDAGAGDVLMVTYSAPFYSGSQFRGVATIDVSLESLQKEAIVDLDNQFFAILGKSGKFISHYNPDLIMNSSIQEQSALLNNADYREIVKNIMAGKNGIGVVNDLFMNGEIINGQSWIFYAPIPSTNWSLSTTTPEEAITSELRSLIGLGALGVAVMIFITFIFVLIISARITRPIKT